MFRLLGPPTWFLSLSAAENLWDDIIVNLVVTDMYARDRTVDLSNWRVTHLDEVQREYKRVKDGKQVEKLVRKYPAVVAKLFDRRLSRMDADCKTVGYDRRLCCTCGVPGTRVAARAHFAMGSRRAESR